MDRAFRWKRSLVSGEVATRAELAEREGIAQSMKRVQRLTLRATDIFEAIFDGRMGAEVTLASLLKPFLVEWVGPSDHSGQTS